MNLTISSIRNSRTSAKTPPITNSTMVCRTTLSSIWTLLISPSIAPCKHPAQPAPATQTWASSGNSIRNRKSDHLPALGASFYVEFPTGDASQQLGSGLIDYWLNFITQKSISDKTRINGNAGYLFAGNTSTGVLGITKVRGHVFAGGVSLLHDFTPRLTLGGEVFGGFSSNGNLARSQLQAIVGGTYAIRNGLAFSFGVLGGRYVASPLIGGQIGFSVDFPDIIRRAPSPGSFR